MEPNDRPPLLARVVAVWPSLLEFAGFVAACVAVAALFGGWWGLAAAGVSAVVVANAHDDGEDGGR